MTRSTRFIGALVALTAIGGATIVAASADRLDVPAQVSNSAFRLEPGPRPPDGVEARTAWTMVNLINAARFEHGLAPLESSDQVSAAARAHAADMAAHSRLQHRGTDGSDGGERLSREGFTWWIWGENLGAGFTSAEPLVAGWLNSNTHNNNLLGDFTHVGVGAVADANGTPYWSLLLTRTTPPPLFINSP